MRSLCDITQHLYDINLKLQGKDNLTNNLFHTLKAF